MYLDDAKVLWLENRDTDLSPLTYYGSVLSVLRAHEMILVGIA